MATIRSMTCPAGRRIRPVPARAGDREGYLREARIGLSVPSKTVSKHRYPLHLPVPFAGQDRAGSDICDTSARVHSALASLFRRARPIKQAAILAIEVTQLIGLQAVSEDAKQEMAWKVRGRRSTTDSLPPAAKTRDIEITQSRNLDIECFAVRQRRTDSYPWHGVQADQRLEWREVGFPPCPIW